VVRQDRLGRVGSGTGPWYGIGGGKRPQSGAVGIREEVSSSGGHVWSASRAGAGKAAGSGSGMRGESGGIQGMAPRPVLIEQQWGESGGLVRSASRVGAGKVAGSGTETPPHLLISVKPHKLHRLAHSRNVCGSCSGSGEGEWWGDTSVG
jgi:hypothetical protein